MTPGIVLLGNAYMCKHRKCLAHFENFSDVSLPVLTHARRLVALYLLMLNKKGINSVDGLGTYIVSLGQHAGLRTPVSTAAAAASFMQHFHEAWRPSAA